MERVRKLISVTHNCDESPQVTNTVATIPCCHVTTQGSWVRLSVRQRLSPCSFPCCPVPVNFVLNRILAPGKAVYLIILLMLRYLNNDVATDMFYSIKYVINEHREGNNLEGDFVALKKEENLGE